ncbi:MAG TPA: endonuclease III domain-containing protein [Thermoguttaceae bacterium]|nr:endonuclease III domain-containing protein [Thermoguttaceae bacterium]
MSGILQQVYERLWKAYGPQHWWPGDGPFEVIVGAVLTQNTSWKNVERAIRNLRDAGLMTPRRLARTPLPELEELIRPAGYYRIKARRLRNLLELIVKRYGGSLEQMFSTPMDVLREELLAVQGVGPETADSILLYAGNLPTFVVDAYTHRVLARHGWIGFDADYYQIKEYFEDQLEPDVQLFNEYHALLVRVGHLHCRRQPKCNGCPLEEMLPEGGPLTPES